MKLHRGQGWRRALRGFERLEDRMLLAAQPIITEFMASNSTTLEDGFGNDSDWVELYNAGDAAVDLQGYYLTDSLNNLTKWSFTTSTMLNPGQYLIVFASDLNTIDPLGYRHTNYKLSAEGEDIALVAPNLTILSQFGPNGDDYPPQVTDISYGVSGPVLVNGNSPASYLIPTNGSSGHDLDGHQFQRRRQRLHVRQSVGRLRHHDVPDQLCRLLQDRVADGHDFGLRPHGVQSGQRGGRQQS